MSTFKDLTPGAYTVDTAHSTVGFVARHLMVSKVRGKFNEFEADVKVGEDLESSSVVATVQMTPSTPARSSVTATCAPTTSSTSRPTRR